MPARWDFWIIFYYAVLGMQVTVRGDSLFRIDIIAIIFIEKRPYLNIRRQLILSETDEDGDDGSDTAAESEIEILFADEDGPQNDEESELEDDGGDSESSDDRFLKFLYFID